MLHYYWIQFHLIDSRYTILSVRYYLQFRIFLPLSLLWVSQVWPLEQHVPIGVRVREDTKRRSWNSGKIKEMACVSGKYMRKLFLAH